MVSELGRVATMLPIAVLAPLAVPQLRPHIWRYAATAVLAAYAVVPPLDELKAAALVGVALLASWVLAPGRPTAPAPSKGALARCFGALACLIGSMLVVDANAVRTALADTIENNDVAVTMAGALAAIFVGGALVGFVLRPFASTLNAESRNDLPSLKTAGTYIGWFERAVFFAFIVAGQPQAAAVALAAKSFARFPSLSEHREGFAEYFLIGTLASIAIAAAAAVATRAILGSGVV